MKIHSTHQSVSSHVPNGRQTLRLLAFCGAVVICVAVCTDANAQSGLFGGVNKPIAERAPSGNEVRNGLFTHGSESFQVVDTAGFRTAADIGETETGSIAQVGYGSCGSCGTSCGGSCGGYGGGSGYAFANACAPCEPYCYFLVEALYMERDGNRNSTASRNFLMDNFDYEWAPRVTIGSVPDCVHGYEASFTGQFEWQRAGALTSPGGGINTILGAVPPVTPANLSAFNNAIFQSQVVNAKYWSVEGNRTLVGWDVAKLLYGVRYLEYDERYTYLSQTATEAGLLRSAVDNQMLGFQVGSDLLYPICRNGYSDFRARAGAFVNFADSDLRVFNAGATTAANFQSRERLAGVIELGGGVRYQLGEMLSVRAGAELWYLTGVATSAAQLRGGILANRKLQMNDDFLITGISFGAQLRY